MWIRTRLSTRWFTRSEKALTFVGMTPAGRYGEWQGLNVNFMPTCLQPPSNLRVDCRRELARAQLLPSTLTTSYGYHPFL